MKLSHDKDGWNQWMDSAVDRILAQCSTLGPGAPKTEDDDDEKAWLCSSLAVRLFPTHTEEGQIHKWGEFNARLAIRALQKCLGLDDWDAHLKSTLLENGNAELQEQSVKSIQWKAFASSYVGLITIELVGEKIIKDDPRCLATVDNAFYCAQTATYLFPSSTSSKDRSGGLYGSPAEADAMCHVLGLLENQCHQLVKRVNPMASRPHFRRAAYHLSCHRGYYRHCREEASALAGYAGKTKAVQQSLESWLSPGNDSDDESQQIMSQ